MTMPEEKKAAFYFKFYPGDYLRDTQNLSEKAQVAYDRIMCEHMRNICLSYAQHKFFTKRLNEDEKEELMQVLRDTGIGFEIPWVVNSIIKAQAYSASRSEIKKGKTLKKGENHMISYDNHMESNINSNSNNSIKTKNGSNFSKPSEEDLIAEFSKKLNASEAEIAARSFLNHYESNGWKVGRNPMKSWTHSVTNWISNKNKFENGINTQKKQPLGTSAARLEALRKW